VAEPGRLEAEMVRWTEQLQCYVGSYYLQSCTELLVQVKKVSNISQGSVASHLECSGIFSDDYWKFIAESFEGQRILKIC